MFASGLALAVALFLPWYGDANAWEALAVTDVLLALTAAAAIGLLLVTARMPSASPAIAYEALLTIFSFIVLVATVFRVLNIPGDLSDRRAGLWLGLLGAAGVLVGSLVAMRDERLSTPGRLTDTTGVPVDAAPEIETLPAPPRGASS